MVVRKILMLCVVVAGFWGLWWGVKGLFWPRGESRRGAQEASRTSSLAPLTEWPTAVRLTQGLDAILGIALDEQAGAPQFVYFATGGFPTAHNALMRVPVAGGAVQELARLTQIPSGELLIDGDLLYFTCLYDGSVMRMPKAGGAVTRIAGAISPRFLAHDATYLYFTTFSKKAESGTLQRIHKANGAVEVLVTGHPALDQPVVDGDALYFRSLLGLFKLPKTGGAPQQLLPGSETRNLMRLTADATHLYFFYASPKGGGRYQIAKLAKAGGAPEVIGPEGSSGKRLALSKEALYAFQESAPGGEHILKIPKTGGAPTLVATHGTGADHLIATESALFFGDAAHLYRLPLP